MSGDKHKDNADSDMGAQNEKMPSQKELDAEIEKNKEDGTYRKSSGTPSNENEGT